MESNLPSTDQIVLLEPAPFSKDRPEWFDPAGEGTEKWSGDHHEDLYRLPSGTWVLVDRYMYFLGLPAGKLVDDNAVIRFFLSNGQHKLPKSLRQLADSGNIATHRFGPVNGRHNPILDRRVLGDDPAPNKDSGMHRSWTKAYESFRVAANALGQPIDREAYEWLKEYGHPAYKLPAYETWERYVRGARHLLGEQKNHPRHGRTGRSLVRPEELDDPKPDENG